MAKKINVIIPEPCHENWDKMTPMEKGRFCDSCQKQVIDFSVMSDREVAQFFKKPSTGSVCGRFLQDQLDRDLEIPKKRIPWAKYFFQIAIPAFFLSAKATAQGTPKATVCTTATFPTKKIGKVVKRVDPPLTSTAVKGTVRNEKGELLPNTIISFSGAANTVATDAKGYFIIHIPATLPALTFFCQGYESATLEITSGSISQEQNIVLRRDRLLDGRGIAVAGEIVARPVEPSLTGVVMDTNGEVVPAARVMLKDRGDSMETNAEGKFVFGSWTKNEKFVLQVSCKGYESQEIVVTKEMRKNGVLIQLKPIAASKDIKEQDIKIRTQEVKSTNWMNAIAHLFSSNKLFPNPVSTGGSVSMEIGLMTEGKYAYELIGVGGQAIEKRELWIDAEARVLSVGIPSVKPGNYIVRLTNSKTGKVFNNKIVIQ